MASGVLNFCASFGEMKASKHQIVLLLVLATVLAYANSLNNSLLWDDDLLVVDNTHVRNWSYLQPAFVTDLFHDCPGGLASHYRPLQTVSYIFDYTFWGLKPFGYHLTNLLLHTVCVLLLYLVMERLSGSVALSWLVAVAFAVHPVNTNAVAYVAGRADPLCFAGMLGSLLLFLKYQRTERVGLYALSMLCYVFSLFSRESAMLLPLLIFLYCTTLGAPATHRLRHALGCALPFAVLTVVFYLWRMEVLELQSKSLHPEWNYPLLLRAEIPFRALATYCGLLVWPAHLQMERQLVTGGAGLHMLTAAGITIVFALSLLARWTWRNAPLACFGLCWFALTVAPVTGLLNLNASVAEHWLYVPAVGAYCCAAALLLRFVTARRAVTIATVALLMLTARTIRRNEDWANPMSLYSTTQQDAPYSARVISNLGQEYINTGDRDRALAALLAAERLEPRHPRVKSNLVAYYLTRGDFDKAQAKAQECLALQPQNTSALLQLAMIDEERKDVAAARVNFIHAIATTTDVRPRLQFGSFLLRAHRYGEALAIVGEVLMLEPGNAQCFNLLGVIMSEQNRIPDAVHAFEAARLRDRHSPDADLNLGRLSALHGDLATARESYQRALRIRPDDIRAHYQLGSIHWRLGNFAEAERELQVASTLAPASSTIRTAIQKVKHRARFESIGAASGSNNS